MSELDITNILTLETLQLLTGLGFVDKTHIDWNDVPFTTPNTDDYCEVRQFRNAPISPLWDEAKAFMGFWQISVMTRGKVGEIVPLQMCQQIAAHFPKNAEFWGGSRVVRITAEPSVLSATADGQITRYPVSIAYRSPG